MPARGQINPELRDADGNFIPWKKRFRDQANAATRLRRQARVAADPQKERESRRKWFIQFKYNLTPELRQALILAQDCKCAICDKELPVDSPKWATDHCHSGGYVRGMLCKPCNSAIGLCKDNPVTLRLAAAYLESTKSIEQDATDDDFEVATRILEECYGKNAQPEFA